MKLAIVGVGLIGGSIGLAARERLGRRGRRLGPGGGRARRGARARRDRPRGAGPAPRRSTAPRRLSSPRPSARCRRRRRGPRARAGEDCVVTDVGSTKRAIVAAVADQRFIGGHPLAGAETAGVRHARAELFDGATWYLTPTAATRGTLYERLLPPALRPRRAAGGARRRDPRPRCWRPSRTCRTCSPTCSSPRPRARCRTTKLPATGPELPRRDPRRGRQHGDLARHLPRQRRRADRARSTTRSRAWTSVRAALDAGDGDAVAAWNDGAREDRRRLLEADLAGGEVCELRVVGAQPPGRRRRGRARARPRRRQHRRHGARTRRPTAPPAPSSLWIAGAEHAAQAEALVAGARATGGAGMNAVFRPRRAAARDARAAGGQVALAPRRAARRDERGRRCT